VNLPIRIAVSLFGWPRILAIPAARFEWISPRIDDWLP
jgi:hypothetical protein